MTRRSIDTRVTAVAITTIVAGLALAGAACSEKKRTEVIVGLATDLTAPTPLAQVNVTVTRLPQGVPVGATGVFKISGVVDNVYALPGTYGVFSDAGTPDRVRVRLVAVDGGNAPLVVRTAVFNLVPERTLFVRLGVITACQGMNDCGEGMTCVEGRCATEEIDSQRLPTYHPGLEREVECPSVATFVDTSTHLALPVTGTSCGSGTCFDGICLTSNGAGGAGGAPGAAGASGATGTGGGGGSGPGPSRPPALIATYLFQNSFAAAEPGAPILGPVDPNGTTSFTPASVLGATRTVWSFAGLASPPASQAGLTLAPAGRVNPRSYSLDMVVELSERNAAWRRLVDVQNRQSDSGFYVDPSNNLAIYPVSGSTAAFTTGDYHHIVLAVDGSTSPTTVTSYLDGAMQFSTATDLMNLDGDPLDNPQQIFNVFLDNVAAGGQGEWSTGQIGLLRLWDGVVTPEQAMTLALQPFPG
jgi:concanavalin A-like lectin/glucanase superfamily protein